MYSIIGVGSSQEFVVNPNEYFCCYSDNNFSIIKYDNNIRKTNYSLYKNNIAQYFSEQNTATDSKVYLVKSGISQAYVNVGAYEFMPKIKDPYYYPIGNNISEIVSSAATFDLSVANIMSQIIILTSDAGTIYRLPSFGAIQAVALTDPALVKRNYGLKIRVINYDATGPITIASSQDGSNTLIGVGLVKDLSTEPYTHNTATFVSFLHADNSYKTYRIS